jgi:pimeloyl-ACP methyl ester carboxylesterase
MGAATALLHGERDPSIASMVLDSSFADLVMLAEEMVEKGRQQGLFAPSLLVRIAIKFIRSSVQKSAHFDIKTLSPIEHADKCFIPALFVAGENDQFVQPSHSEKIYEKYGGDKNIIIVEGDHNTPRPRYLYDAVSVFLQSTLQVKRSNYLLLLIVFNSLFFFFFLLFFDCRFRRIGFSEKVITTLEDYPGPLHKITRH